MTLLVATANVVAFCVLPWIVVGAISRTKALWSGRKGPPILQSAYDVLRLLRKTPVYSATTTPVFRLTPYVGLAATLAAGIVVPLLGVPPIVSFGYDFIWFAYLWGLGRLALMLGALDTGSSFEGMGASREATYATLVEPALLMVLGALCAVTGNDTLVGALGIHLASGPAVVAWLASLFALLVVVQAEGARMPVDDPTTHLELTMIHEVMVLDHSGPELAVIQTGAAVKLTLGISLVAALLNPWSGTDRVAAAIGANLVLTLAIAVLFGTVESLVARLQLRVLPRYLLTAVVAGGVALLATTWQEAIR
jgi:formate hydrogenlyase subunit 4